MSEGRKQNRGKPKWLWILLIGFIVLAVVIGGLVWNQVRRTKEYNELVRANQYKVDLTINGDEMVVLEYGATYDEPGANAVGYGTHLQTEPQKLQVQIDGNVDVFKPGNYEVTYSAAFEGTEASAVRTVQVVDVTAPELTLIGESIITLSAGDIWTEPGCTAVDVVDGDVTELIVITGEVDTAVPGSYLLTYAVADTAQNAAKIERTVQVVDTTAPELTLMGESKITITEGNKWKDPGCVATDNVDGDITQKVVVSGTVNDSKPGTYKLTYEVFDNNNNSAKVERTVTVKEKPKPQPENNTQNGGQGNATQDTPSSNTQGKVIYLTFDDGPSNYTPKLLDILAKYNVKATFFVCGSGRVDLLDDIANAGHTLALHSKTHKYASIYASDEAFYNDLYAIQEIVEKYAGVKSYITRFPGGSSNSISKNYSPGIMTRLTQSLPTKGFTYFDWNVDSRDADNAKTASAVANNVINGISKSKRKSLVVLQHDIKGYSVDAVEEIIQWGLANGCTFKALTADSPSCKHGVNN